MGPRAGLDGRKTRPHRDSIPDDPGRSSVAIPTELPGPQNKGTTECKSQKKLLLVLSFLYLLYPSLIHFRSKYFSQNFGVTQVEHLTSKVTNN